MDSVVSSGIRAVSWHLVVQFLMIDFQKIDILICLFLNSIHSIEGRFFCYTLGS